MFPCRSDYIFTRSGCSALPPTWAYALRLVVEPSGFDVWTYTAISGFAHIAVPAQQLIPAFILAAQNFLKNLARPCANLCPVNVSIVIDMINRQKFPMATFPATCTFVTKLCTGQITQLFVLQLVASTTCRSCFLAVFRTILCDNCFYRISVLFVIPAVSFMLAFLADQIFGICCRSFIASATNSHITPRLAADCPYPLIISNGRWSSQQFTEFFTSIFLWMGVKV